MAIHRVCVILVGVSGGTITATEPVSLREKATAGQVTRAVVELKAEGLYRPGPPPSDPSAKDAKPSRALKLRVATRLAFVERVLSAGPDEAAGKVARKVEQAASAINGE